MAVEEVAKEAAIDEALKLFGFADDWREWLVPAWVFNGFRGDIVIEILLFAEQILEALSA